MSRLDLGSVLLVSICSLFSGVARAQFESEDAKVAPWLVLKSGGTDYGRNFGRSDPISTLCLTFSCPSFAKALRPELKVAASQTPYLAEVLSATGFFVSSTTFVTAGHICQQDGTPPGVCRPEVEVFSASGPSRTVVANCTVHPLYLYTKSRLWDFAKCTVATAGFSAAMTLPLCAKVPGNNATAGEAVTGAGFGCHNDKELFFVSGVASGGLMTIAKISPGGEMDLSGDNGSKACAGDSGGPLFRGHLSKLSSPTCVEGVVTCGWTNSGPCITGSDAGANQIDSVVATWLLTP